MNDTWPTRKLRELADIRVSNVDKKAIPGEKPVKLCNYMDVYSNEYVTSSLPFMEASATDAELERFSLNKDDVIITKDSETPDDIGIPSVVMEQINNLVCGYHLALIRPNADQLDSIYLAKQLSTSRVARYFSLHASGSTRFGLPISAIEAVDIPTPPKPEQTKIAEILSTVDRAIEQTEALIAKQQRIKTGLMQDLLTRGIDEHGNLRTEQTHKFKDSPLGRIPVEWEVDVFKNRVDLVHGHQFRYLDFTESGYPVVKIGQVTEQGLDLNNCDFVSFTRAEEFEKYRIRHGDVLMALTGATLGKVCRVSHNYADQILLQNYRVGRFEPFFQEDIDKGYFFYLLQTDALLNQVFSRVNSGAQGNVGKADFERAGLLLPPYEEQCKIGYLLTSLGECMSQLQNAVKKVRSLKTALMQDLLTGKKRVTRLLNDMEVPSV